MNRREMLIRTAAMAPIGVAAHLAAADRSKSMLDARRGDRGIVRDATGKEIPLVIACVPLSGFVIEFVPDDKGLAQLDPANTSQLWTREAYYPAPLTVEPLPEVRRLKPGIDNFDGLVNEGDQRKAEAREVL